MKEISVRDMRAMLTRLDEVLVREGEIVLTRHGKPIARLLPLPAMRNMPSHAEFRARMPRLRVGSESMIRRDRDEQ